MKAIFLILGLFFAGGFFLARQSFLPQFLPTLPQEITGQEELTLEKIFQSPFFDNNLPKERIRVLIITGDIIPARSVNFQTVKAGDFRWPFLKTYQALQAGDLTLINLEAPLVEGCPLTQEGMVFCGDLRHVEGLQWAGIDVANLANNHAGNYGTPGVLSTIRELEKHNIEVTGVKEPLIKDVRGLKFAFLGYNDVGETQTDLSSASEERICQEIKEVRELADVVIPSFHWGTEYVSQPTPRQISLAHLAVDCGADLVIGNHPHWIQPLEIYQGKVIVYAHGNFIFDQMWSEKTREGIVGKYTFFDNQLIGVEFLPVKIENYGQPFFLEGSAKERVLQDMAKESLKLQATLVEQIKSQKSQD